MSQMFTDFVKECSAARSGASSSMIADEVKVGGSDAALEAAEVKSEPLRATA